jgi:hypothetical protein
VKLDREQLMACVARLLKKSVKQASSRSIS